MRHLLVGISVFYVVVAYQFGWLSAQNKVVRECESLGGFYVGKQTFHCYEIEGPSHDSQ